MPSELERNFIGTILQRLQTQQVATIWRIICKKFIMLIKRRINYWKFIGYIIINNIIRTLVVNCKIFSSITRNYVIIYIQFCSNKNRKSNISSNVIDLFHFQYNRPDFIRGEIFPSKLHKSASPSHFYVHKPRHLLALNRISYLRIRSTESIQAAITRSMLLNVT